MAIELRDRPAPTRCPYCHDQLELPDLEPLECVGCGTLHHRICLDELGGCTVQGCPEASSGPPPASTAEEIRGRIRERARRFAKNRERYGSTAPPMPPPRNTNRGRKDLLELLGEMAGSCSGLPLFLTVMFCLAMIAIVIWAALTGA